MPGRFLQVLEHVAKSCGRQHRGARALSLDDRGVRNGRAMHELGDIGEIEVEPRGPGVHAL